jgi:hypothetical protein
MAMQSFSVLVIRMYHSTLPSSYTKCVFEASGHFSKREIRLPIQWQAWVSNKRGERSRGDSNKDDDDNEDDNGDAAMRDIPLELTTTASINPDYVYPYPLAGQ